MIIPESAYRSDDFQENMGVWVKMPDGQSWLFARPVIEFIPKFVNGKIEASLNNSFGDDYVAKLEANNDNNENTTVQENIAYMFSIAVDLLRRSYNLTDDQLTKVLRYQVGNSECWTKIMTIAGGGVPPDAPKFDGDGSDMPES